MKKITNLIILDASGSMGPKANEVIGGLKLLFKDIKKSHDQAKVHTIVTDFSSPGDFRVLVNDSKKKSLKKKVAESYETRGMTALYDAIGKSFELVPDGQDGVFVSIMTDGQENSSREFDPEALKSLIEKKRNEGWHIEFMGVDEASLQQAKGLGITHTIRYDNSTVGTRAAGETRSASMLSYMDSVVESKKEE